MANSETPATVTHIRLTESRLFDFPDNPEDAFGSSTVTVISLLDRIGEIDTDAAVYLCERVSRELAAGTVAIEDAILMLQNSCEQMENLARSGHLHVFAA